MKRNIALIILCIVIALIGVSGAVYSVEDNAGFLSTTFGKFSVFLNKLLAPGNKPAFLKGCYLEFTRAPGGLVDGRIQLTDAGGAEDDCKSYALAFRYADIDDALRLALKYNPQRAKELGAEIKGRPLGRKYAVKYKYSPTFETVVDVEEYSGSEKQYCEMINFFGLNLYCYNLGKDENGPPHIAKIIKPLTFLRMAGYPGNFNPIRDAIKTRPGFPAKVEPFDFLVQERILFINGDQLGSGDIEDLACDSDGGKVNSCFRFTDANFDKIHPYSSDEAHSGELYDHLLDDTDKKYAAIMYLMEKRKDYGMLLYHEAQHKFFGVHVAALESKDCPPKNTLDDYEGITGDKGWASPNGAEVALAFQLSGNGLLKCSERKDLYQLAVDFMRGNMCTGVLACPEHPKEVWQCVDNKHIYPEPDCE